MSKDPTEQTEQTKQNTKHDKKPYFQIADDALFITYDDVPRIHRVVFRNSELNGNIPIKSSVFVKLNNLIKITEKNAPWAFYKNGSCTIGLTKHGKIVIHVKTSLKLFPSHFIELLKAVFHFEDHEIRFLIERLKFVEMEIAHKINDPLKNLKNSVVKYDFEGLVKKLKAFTDNSQGTSEIELKGDPETSGNLAFLLSDKLHAVEYFAELTKLMAIVSKRLFELKSQIEYVNETLIKMINDLLKIGD